MGLEKIVLGHYPFTLKRLPLSEIAPDPNNMRQSLGLRETIKLQNSIKNIGVLQPICVNKKKIKRKHELICGERRWLCSMRLDLPDIPAKIYRNLPKDVVLEMQVAENTTKAKIPASELALNHWELYKFYLSDKLGVKMNSVSSYQTYWDIPEELRRKYSLGAYCKKVNKSRDAITTAFYFAGLHTKLQKRAANKRDRFNYTIGAELAKVRNQKKQLELEEKIKREDGGYPTRNKVKAFVKDYFEAQKKEPRILKLQSDCIKSNRSHGDTAAYCRFRQVAQFMNTFAAIVEIDRAILGYQGIHVGAHSAKSIIKSYKNQFAEFYKKFEESDIVRMLHHEQQENGRSIVDKVMSGSYSGCQKIKEAIRSLKYELVPVNKVVPDSKQPRKTFDEKELDGLANSLKRIGQLQLALLKPIKGGFRQIIIGERRWRALQKAGISHIESLIVDLPDDICRQIQHEEDLFEEVIKYERAEAIARLYRLRKKQKGKSYGIEQFIEEHKGIGAWEVRSSLYYDQLDKRTKELNKAGLLKYEAAILLGSVKSQTERFEWALDCVINNYTKQQLEHALEKSKHQENSLFRGLEKMAHEGRRKLLASKLTHELGFVSHYLHTQSDRICKNKILAGHCESFFNAYNKIV